MAKKKTATVALIGLAAIVAATQDANKGFAFVGSDEANKLAADGLIEIAPEGAVANTPAGQVAARATQKGIDSLQPQNSGSPFTGASEGATAGAATDSGKPSFVIEDVPDGFYAVSGRGRIGSVYPFDALEVGKRFFVAKPAKNLASTVSSANARYAVPDLNPDGSQKLRIDRNKQSVPAMKFTRHFVVRSGMKDGVSGSWIARKA